jgi:capsular exopolysaccharide synthesis family protein
MTAPRGDEPRIQLDPFVAADERRELRHIRDYLRVLHKRRRTVTTAFLLIVITTTLVTFTTVPIYESKARLLIESENPSVVNIKEVVQESQGRGDYYTTQYNILQSRSLARKTIDQLNLWSLGSAPTPSTLNARRVIRTGVDAVAGWFSSSRAPTGAPQAGETARESAAIDAFLGHLTIAPVRNSRLVDLLFRSPDPATASQAVNMLARLYIEQSLEFKFMSSKEASDWLGERLAEQRAKVEEAEAGLQRYREEKDAVSLDERQNIVVQKLSDLNAAVTRAKTLRIEKESLYNQLRSIQHDRSALDTFPGILSNSFIQALKTNVADLQRQYATTSQTLGERHPEMKKLKSSIDATEARLQGEIGKVVESVRNEFLTAQAQENRLIDALDAQKGEALSLNRRGIEYGVLRREAESNRQIYDSLLQRAKETSISSELKTSNIRIIDPGETPRSPVVPRTRLNLMLGVFGGALFAIGLAFFFEYFDNRIRTPEEIKTHLGLPFLGFIPVVIKAGDTHAYPLLNNGVAAGFVEAFRAIRTNVLFSSVEEGSRSLVITSSGPNEGKTLVATNLAMAMAQSGQRVLLIDADMRRPNVHSAFDLPADPGLSNVLVGDARASDAVKSTMVTGLWVLPGGRRSPNPAELLGSKRFRDFLTTLQEQFDWVILDSPPIMAVTDAALVSHVVSGVLFVVGAEMTSRAVARHALEQLAAAQGRTIGGVLNRIDLRRNAYYYSQYYRREYTKYYAGV